MSYIGQGLPADTFQGFTTDKFTGDGTANKTFTLTKEPFSEDTILVTIDGVIQEPTDDFTVSGTTLTLVGTAANNSEINVTHMGGPLPIGGAAELDLNGASDKLILDADGDTTISADTDDQIDFKAGGTDIFQLTATTATFNDNVSINIDDNTDGLTITSTDADATNGPGLRLFRNSASPADGDDIGRIIFSGENDASEQINYAIIRGDLLDVTDGTEDGIIKYETIFAGTNREMIRMGNGEGVIVNEDGIDMDFRVEGDSNSKILVADGGDNGVYFGNNGNTTPAQSSTATHAFISAIGRMQISASSAACITTNRVNSEGITIELRQAGGVRGSISVAGASAAFNTSSDYRLKENVDYTWDGTTILKQLKPAKFNWKVDPDNTVHGFIAHEAKAVVPDSVIGGKDAVDDNGDVSPQQIDQSKLVPILVKTVQELEARIKTLEDA